MLALPNLDAEALPSRARAALLTATIALGTAVLLRIVIEAMQRRRRLSKDIKGASPASSSSKADSQSTADHDYRVDQQTGRTPHHQQDQLLKDKELYHRLHNLHQYPEAIPEAHSRLLALFDETISASSSDSSSIHAAVPTYSREGLEKFLAASHDATSEKYSAYVARRHAGGAREMFTDRQTAMWWLKNSAPVKYVDGTWIAHVHKVTEKIKERPASAIAWQVMSEELGDGTLVKNHVYVYEELMRSLECALSPL